MACRHTGRCARRDPSLEIPAQESEVTVLLLEIDWYAHHTRANLDSFSSIGTKLLNEACSVSAYDCTIQSESMTNFTPLAPVLVLLWESKWPMPRWGQPCSLSGHPAHQLLPRKRALQCTDVAAPYGSAIGCKQLPTCYSKELVDSRIETLQRKVARIGQRGSEGSYAQGLGRSNSCPADQRTWRMSTSAGSIGLPVTLTRTSPSPGSGTVAEVLSSAARCGSCGLNAFKMTAF